MIAPNRREVVCFFALSPAALAAPEQNGRQYLRASLLSPGINLPRLLLLHAPL
jgi:hypothetical protein